MLSYAPYVACLILTLACILMLPRDIDWWIGVAGRPIRGWNWHMNAIWRCERQVRIIEKRMHAADDAKADCGERNVPDGSSMAIERQPICL